MQTIVCINEQMLIYGHHIDDVMTSLRRRSEMVGFFTIKAKTSLKSLMQLAINRRTICMGHEFCPDRP